MPIAAPLAARRPPALAPTPRPNADAGRGVRPRGPATRPATGPATEMVDLTRALSPEARKRVDPRVLDFYRRPLAYDLRVAAEFPDAFSRFLLGVLAPAISGLGHITEGEGPAEATLYRDAAGRTHWDRYAVIDGRRERLFIARFELEGRQVKETFDVRGMDVALYFDVEPYQGGLRLTLDRRKSSKLAALADITFVTLPSPQGVVSTGSFVDRSGLLRAAAHFRMTRRGATSPAERP